jgi:hypothetical protein
MSRLYSSPEVTSVEVTSFGKVTRPWIAVIVVASPDAVRVMRVESQSRRIFNPTKILSYVAFNKDAFPNRRRTSPAGSNHSACQNKPILLNAGVFLTQVSS